MALLACEEEFNAISDKLNEALIQAWSVLILSQDFFAGKTVLVVTDPGLFSLPIETSPLFAKARSVSREFSLWMLWQRMSLYRLQAAKQPTKDVGYIVDAWAEDQSPEAHFKQQLTRVAGLDKKSADSRKWNLSEGVSGID